MENTKVQNIIGHRVIEAMDFLEEMGFDMRIIREDNVDFILTQDMMLNRINVEVKNDIVVQIDGIY